MSAMQSTKKKKNKFVSYLLAPFRLLRNARDFYTNTLCDCAGKIGHVGEAAGYVTLPHQPSHSHFSRSFSSVKESRDIQELRDFIRVMTMKNTEGTIKETDDERKLRAFLEDGRCRRSYSIGVGRIGRIDEDLPCDFVEVVDIKKKIHPMRNYAVTSNSGVSALTM